MLGIVSQLTYDREHLLWQKNLFDAEMADDKGDNIELQNSLKALLDIEG